MPVTIEIPTAFRRFTDGAPRVDCSAATVADALDELTSRFPDLSRHVRDDQGQIRQFLNVYLNEEDIRFLGGESCSLKEGDRVLLASLPIPRWHGMMIGMGLLPFANPTARTALGLPMRSASCK